MRVNLYNFRIGESKMPRPRNGSPLVFIRSPLVISIILAIPQLCRDFWFRVHGLSPVKLTASGLNRQDQAQRQGWRCCQGSLEGYRRMFELIRPRSYIPLSVLRSCGSIRRTSLARSALPPPSTVPRPFSSLGRPSTPASRSLMSPVSTPTRLSFTLSTPRVP